MCFRVQFFAMDFPFISIIIPVKEINDYIRQAVPWHLALDYPNLEILILPDEDLGERFGPKVEPHLQLVGGALPHTTEGDTLRSFMRRRVRIIPTSEAVAGSARDACTYSKTGPADKRDLGAREAKGEILAFTDDDAYPHKDWLKNAVGYFEDPKVAAVCGPGVTPPGDSVLQKAGGWVSASFLGGGPEAYYRFLPGKRREVDDYPSVNLIVRRSDYEAAGGYDSHFWPGEDTKLCLDLTEKLGKKIIYDPEVVVYHHRRALFGPHLKQNGRYGLHRGHFARVLPATSRRLSYFIPSLFTLFFFGVPIFNFLISAPSPRGKFLNFLVSNFSISFIYTVALSFYLLLLLATAAWVYFKERDWVVALLVIPGIFVTHIWYGIKFIQGYFSRGLKG